MSRLGKSASLPGIMSLGISGAPKLSGHNKKVSLDFKMSGVLGSAMDLHRGLPPTEEALRLSELMKKPGWRLSNAELYAPPPPTDEDLVPANMRHPTISPAWLKHEKQVLRFYGFFQEAVVERPDENSRYRQISIMYFMEDGTMRISEPRVENSGIQQGSFLRRHRVPRDDGQGFIGPDDLRCGAELTFYGRTYHMTGCDRFTRWFYEQNGIDVGEDEPLMMDLWQKSYKLTKTIEKGGVPPTKSAVDSKTLMKFQLGAPPADKKFIQFLLNDRKVLRFKGFWDDHTLYGARVYFVIHYYLSDNTVEINEAHCRNSGRDKYPGFMKRGPLHKKNSSMAVPGMLAADAPLYLPEDFVVGSSIEIWGRTVMLYDCDDFTRNFFQDYLGIDQFEGKIDVSDKPVKHRKLAPPPHNGIGKPEDSLISTQMIVPKAPKIDLAKMMTKTGEILRFEAKFVNGEPEDEMRRLVISYYPMDDEVMVAEIPVRNSGHMAGKFAAKRRIHNPDSGEYFKLTDFFVGARPFFSGQPLLITRADEHCLQYLEAHPEEFPYADFVSCCRQLAALAEEPEMNDPMGIDPDRLKELAFEQGCPVVDHEIITLLRRYGLESDDGTPKIFGPAVLETGAS
mmetsp:Transcript_13121/g.20773  ORF Transcript_13121/g.20773 Transcript_13121/m.20773 type:complete len:623 (+) Transcript_13121:118-1986(+)